MKYNCDMIRDLLPLYQDGICSESSRQAVEAHLSECPSCAGYLEADRGLDEFEGAFNLEREKVLTSQAKYFKRKSAVAGTILAGLFMLPVLICLIVNLAQGGLTWFIIVLAAMLIPFSLIAVPLLAPENKALWMLGSFTVSLLMLLAVCCIYSGGNWFFIASTAVLFGLSVIFGPFAVRAKPIAEKLGSRKALTVMALDTGLLLAMLTAIGATNRLGLGYFGLAAAISLPILAWIWTMFLTIRYTKWNGLVKTGVCLAAAGIVLFVNIFLYRVESSALYIGVFGKTFFVDTNKITAAFCLILGLLIAVPAIIKDRNRRK